MSPMLAHFAGYSSWGKVGTGIGKLLRELPLRQRRGVRLRVKASPDRVAEDAAGTRFLQKKSVCSPKKPRVLASDFRAIAAHQDNLESGLLLAQLVGQLAA